MKLPMVVCIVVATIAVSPARAGTSLDEATPVSIPAGPLDDAVDALARQVGVNVLYPGNLLDGRVTAGVNATLTRMDAFTQLLKGNSLDLIEERGAVRIAMAPVAAEPATEIRADRLETSSECHRILEGHDIRPYCGSPAQWAALRESVGLRCKKEGGGSELCSSSAQWRRLSDTRIKRLKTEHTDVRPLDATVLGDAPQLDAECHRLLQGNRGRRFCGNSDQWQELRARAGFSCRNEGTRNELCATASEWKRWELRQSRQREPVSFFRIDEGSASAALNNPTNPGVQATVSAPVSKPGL